MADKGDNPITESDGALDPLTDLSEAVRYHRHRAELTRLELAQLAGVGKTVVFDIESGKRTVRVQTLLRVLDALNIRLSWTSPLRATFLENRRDASRSSARSR